MKPRREGASGIIIWAIYIILALCFTYPGIARFSTHLIGDGGDNLEYYSYTLLVKESLDQLRWPFAHTTTFWYPEGFDMTIGSEAKLFTVFVALLSYLLPPVLSYNLGVIFFLVLNSWCTYYLFKKIGFGRGPSFAGGLLYGMSYYVLAKAGGHINLMLIFPIPLFAACLFDVYKERQIGPWQFICLAAVGILLFLSSAQYAVIVLSILLLFTPVIMWELRTIRPVPFSVKNPFIVIIAISVMMIAMRIGLPYINLAKTYSFSRDSFRIPRSVDAVNLVMPNNYLTPLIYAYLSPSPLREGSIEHSIYLGYGEIALVVLWIIWARKKPYSLIALLFGIVCMIVSLGQPLGNGNWSFYGYLQHFFPFSIIWESERFFIIYYLIFTYCIVALLQQTKRYKPILFMALLFILLERFSGNFYVTDMIELTGKPYASTVAKMTTAAVMDVPFLHKEYLPVPPTRYNLLPMQYQKPIVGGYYHWLAENKTNTKRLSGVAEALTCDTQIALTEEKTESVIDALRIHDIRVIVVHKSVLNDESCLAGRNGWYSFYEYFTARQTLSQVHDDDDVEVFYIGSKK
jgi:hypothetical protein